MFIKYLSFIGILFIDFHKLLWDSIFLKKFINFYCCLNELFNHKNLIFFNTILYLFDFRYYSKCSFALYPPINSNPIYCKISLIYFICFSSGFWSRKYSKNNFPISFWSYNKYFNRIYHFFSVTCPSFTIEIIYS